MVRVSTAEEDMGRRRRAEPAGEGDMPGMVEALAAEEHHLPGQERVADGADLAVGERCGQVDADDFGADVD